MAKLKFPENFWWGSATSGPQSEGRFNKRNRNIFDYWYDTDKKVFFNEVGPDVASNFYNSFKEDIALYKKIGLNSLRTSIQWTRLIKDFETGEVDEKTGTALMSAIRDALKANDTQYKAAVKALQ